MFVCAHKIDMPNFICIDSLILEKKVKSQKFFIFLIIKAGDTRATFLRHEAISMHCDHTLRHDSDRHFCDTSATRSDHNVACRCRNVVSQKVVTMVSCRCRSHCRYAYNDAICDSRRDLSRDLVPTMWRFAICDAAAIFEAIYRAAARFW